jgi:hypothetical protein
MIAVVERAASGFTDSGAASRADSFGLGGAVDQTEAVARNVAARARCALAQEKVPPSSGPGRSQEGGGAPSRSALARGARRYGLLGRS